MYLEMLIYIYIYILKAVMYEYKGGVYEKLPAVRRYIHIYILIRN